MKNILALLILIYICFNIVCASYASFIDKSEYPDSYDVEPKTNLYMNDNSVPLEASVENIIEVNLDDCIRLALGNNPKIQAAMQDVFSADSRIKQVWSNYFPQLSWQTGYSRIRQLQLSDVFQENLIYNFWVLGQISCTQLLYDFGITQNQAAIRKLDKKGYEILLTNTINDIVYQVKDCYYSLQYALEAKRVALSNVKEYEKFYEQAKLFYLSGMKPKVDVTIAEVNLSNAKLILIQTDHTVNISMAKLNNAIGINYNIKYNLTDKLCNCEYNINLDDAVKICEKTRPEFELAEVKVKQAEQNIKLVQKNWRPQFIAQGQFEIGGRHPDSNYGYTFGAYLNFPVINGILLKHQINEAKILYAKSKANLSEVQNNIYFEVQDAYYSLNEKKNKLPVAFLGMKQAKENYELSYGRYKSGVGNPVELNDAHIQYENSQLTYYKVLYELNSAKANLEKAIGRNLYDNGEIISK